jgi:hypothetical protein
MVHLADYMADKGLSDEDFSTADDYQDIKEPAQ